MPPKKRDKEIDTSKNTRTDHIQADHELFLQAFEKPTQIYRFLRARNMLSPVFLNRTLSYMRQRMSRSHKKRANFKVDSLLEQVVLRQQTPCVTQPFIGFMTLTFLGFYDKKRECHEEPVKVETLLLKICHKKRKEVSCPVMTVSLGSSYVPYNPSEDYPPPKAPAVSIPTESFSLSNGHLVKSYHLLLRVGAMSSNILTPNSDIDSEPAQKKKKLNGTGKPVGVNGIEEGSNNGSWHQFGTDLVIYDKQNRCLLSDGDYELLLEELNTNPAAGTKVSTALTSWEYIGPIKEEHGDHLTSFEKFSSGPTLKFRLQWSKEPITSIVDRPKPLGQIDESLDNNSNKENNRPERTAAGTGKKCKNEETASAKTSKLKIVYQFLYNNNSRQQTEACEDLHCPWCSLDCSTLYALLKHLKLCHSRFTFTYVPIPQGARIDVAINEHYDGSYTGSPQDLISQPPGLAFSRSGPVRRTSVSNILVCHPKRPRPSLSEFVELDENEFDCQRPYITGHNRLYHHTTTCLPIYPKEMDIDSEDENDPKWLQTKTQMMIDDFTDVNEGEKELMKMWNLHVMRHGYVGDCQIPLACTMFLNDRGRTLLLKNLYRNFVLHMCNLFDFGLVSPVTVYTTIQKLQEMIRTEENDEVSKVLQESCKAQRQHWLLEGVNKPITETRRRNKASTHFSSPKPERQRIASENVSKKRTSEQPVRNIDKKLATTPEKRKASTNLKPEGNAKKKQPVTGGVVSPRIQLTNTKIPKEPLVGKEASGVKLRRKSSSEMTSSLTAIQQRRKSFAGATETLRKKVVENGIGPAIAHVIPLENSRRRPPENNGTSVGNKTNVS
ncbi:polycomb protein Su(z)12 [Lycorma delicatula]|uniref:polycomb protein Su(z)12 n=1 Tax=Lycorma delicatula TaxID=130591 RepID=UPI003F51A7BE